MGGNKDGEIMKETTNYGFKKPGKNEYININVLNENMDKVDLELDNLKKANTAAINRQDHIMLITFAAPGATDCAPMDAIPPLTRTPLE